MIAPEAIAFTSRVIQACTRGSRTRGRRFYSFYHWCNNTTKPQPRFKNNSLLLLPQHQPFVHLNKASSSIVTLRNKAAVALNCNSSEEIIKTISSFQNSSSLLLLDYVETVDLKMLNNTAIDVTSRLLHQLIVNQGYHMRREVLISSGFQKFCKSVKTLGRTLDSQILVNICNLFHHLEMPLSDVRFQFVLRLLSKHANAMEISQIVYLSFIIDQILSRSSSPLVEAVQKVLPRIFENQLHLQIVNSSMPELCKYLQFAVKANCSEQCLRRIVRVISEKQRSITPSLAPRILCSLADSNPSMNEGKQLLQSLFDILSRDINAVEVRFLDLVLRKCAKQFRLGRTEFYDQNFLEAVIKQMLHFGDKNLILNSVKVLSTMRHVSIDFLEAFADIVTSDSSVLLQDDLFFSLVRALSHANYKPSKWMLLEALLCNHPAVDKVDGVRLISMTLDFMVLDILPVQFLKRVFSFENAAALEVWFQKSGPHSLIIMLNATKHLYGIEVLYPSASVVAVWKEVAKTKICHYQYPLKSALQFALGGETYVITGLVHEGIHIDHCVLMNEKGIPVMFDEQKPTSLDSIPVPHNCTLCLIKVVARAGQNAQRIEGIQGLESRILETYGHPITEINALAWQELLESEKIPYILQKLKESKRSP